MSSASEASHRPEQKQEEEVDDDVLLPDLFQEPDGYYKPPDPAHWVTHTLLSGQKLRLRLVGSNPLPVSLDDQSFSFFSGTFWHLPGSGFSEDLVALHADFAQSSRPHPIHHPPLSTESRCVIRSDGRGGVVQANHIWNAALALSLYLQQASPQPHVQPGHSTVLELGAAAGLPSLTAAILGARTVVATDYPDETILDNLRTNVRENAYLLPGGSRDAPARDAPETGVVVVEPHLWGSDASQLLAHLHQPATPTPVPSISNLQATPGHAVAEDGFSLVLMADVLYTPHSHRPLLASLRRTLSRTDKNAKALVFSCPYRPWLWDQDLEFFRLCEGKDSKLATRQKVGEVAGEGGEPSHVEQTDSETGEALQVTALGRMPGGRVMFPNDPGFAPGPEGERARTEVWGWEIRWRHSL